MHDTDLRRLARDEQFTDAIDLTDPDDRGDIGDELLRLMHRGLLLHYAGEYEASNEVLQRAEAIAEARFTKSISKAALSMITSDRILAWVPNDTERLMINYYGALNYLALGDPDEAAVEARRLSYLLELSEDEDFDPAEAEIRTALRYFAGSVFQASGDPNDAAVAYRHVWTPEDLPPEDAPLRPRFLELYGPGAPVSQRTDVAAAPDRDELAEDSPADLAEGSLADLAGPPPAAAPDSAAELIGPPAPAPGVGGDVVVIVERGLIAHRVERSLNVPLFPEESDAFRGSDDGRRQAAATCIASRAFESRYDVDDLFAGLTDGWRRDSDGRCIVEGSSGDRDDEEEGVARLFYLMRVAWPEMVPSGLPGDLAVRSLGIASGPLPLQVASLDGEVPNSDSGFVPGPASNGESGAPVLAGPQLNASLSDAAIAEFNDQLAGILVKAVARSAAKYGLARGLEKELKKKDELLGEIALLTANAATALLERADTRCWHLLPDQVSVIRLRLPAGRHPLSLQVDTGGAGSRLIDLGEVEVGNGTVRVVSTRIWP